MFYTIFFSSLFKTSTDIYAHHIKVETNHSSEIHQFACMFPTLIPCILGPLHSANLDWKTIAKWFLNHSLSTWHEDPLFISHLFDCFSDQIIHEELLTHSPCLNQLIHYLLCGAWSLQLIDWPHRTTQHFYHDCHSRHSTCSSSDVNIILEHHSR